MSQTLTEWWKQLDEETRNLANKYEEINYPANFKPDKDVEVTGEMSPWIALHKMASLGAAIETNIMFGHGIASKIDTAGKKLGEQLPNSPRYIPIITDERSLLFTVIYYRSQCRFQNVQSSNSTIQRGMLGIPGLEQNKPTIAHEAEILKKKIKDYCSAHQEIANKAQIKFQGLFPEENALGSDLFKAKDISEQYTDFVGLLIGGLINRIEEESHEQVYKRVLLNLTLIKKRLENTKIQLETLYLYKKLQEFIEDIHEYSEMTCNTFMKILHKDGKLSTERAEKAQKIWEEVEQFVHKKKFFSEKITEGVNKYTPGFLQNILHAFVNPLAYLPWLVGLDEKARLKRFKGHFNSHLSTVIERYSGELENTTGMKAEDLKIASSQNIQNLLTINHELSLEISKLRKSLQSYIDEVGNDKLIKLSKAPFLGWITKQLAKCEWTSRLLYDNIHYIKIASNFMEELSCLENKINDGGKLSANELNQVKKSVHAKATGIKEGSHYLLFRTHREQAYKQLSTIINTHEQIAPKQ
jgi:regulator of replication initiation timing